MEIKSIFRSSLDPSKVSLTVQSISKMVIFFVGYIAVSKGLDPETATTQVEAITEIFVSIIPACFAVYHGLEAIYGIVRKFFVVK